MPRNKQLLFCVNNATFYIISPAEFLSSYTSRTYIVVKYLSGTCLIAVDVYNGVGSCLCEIILRLQPAILRHTP